MFKANFSSNTMIYFIEYRIEKYNTMFVEIKSFNDNIVVKVRFELIYILQIWHIRKK